jgi:hypothetical protein
MSDYLVPVNADMPALDAMFLPGEDTIADPIGVEGLGELVIVAVGHRERGVQCDRQADHGPAHHARQTPVSERAQKHLPDRSGGPPLEREEPIHSSDAGLTGNHRVGFYSQAPPATR